MYCNSRSSSSSKNPIRQVSLFAKIRVALSSVFRYSDMTDSLTKKKKKKAVGIFHATSLFARSLHLYYDLINSLMKVVASAPRFESAHAPLRSRTLGHLRSQNSNRLNLNEACAAFSDAPLCRDDTLLSRHSCLHPSIASANLLASLAYS